jgi:2-hydroxychromene-2-carboxylate isomerase
MAVAADAIFYFDFNSPYAYLAAERIGDLIPDAEWKPIAFPILLNQIGRLESALARDPRAVLEVVSPRAAERGLPPILPPQGWPVQTWSLAPLRAALFADEQGRLKEFSAAAFGEVFVESLSLTELDNLLAAAREAGARPGRGRASRPTPRDQRAAEGPHRRGARQGRHRHPHGRHRRRALLGRRPARAGRGGRWPVAEAAAGPATA